MAARRSRSRTRSKAAREFVSEVEEIVERMREDLLELAEARGGEEEVPPDLVNRLFRAAHSLKGVAGMFGFDGMGELAHHLEDVLDGLRLGRLPSDSPALDLLDEAVALVAHLLQQVGVPEAQEEAAASIGGMIGRIESALRQPAPKPAELENLALDPALLRALTEYEEHRLRENVRRGRAVYLVEVSFEILSFEEGLSELTRAVNEVGELISTLPAPGDVPESQIRFSLLVATQLASDELATRLDFPRATVQQVYAPGGASTEPEPSAPAHSRAAPAAPAPPESEEVAAGAEEPHAEPAEVATPAASSVGIESLKSISETVRVDIRKLDELMNLVGELVIQRSALGTIAARLAADPATARVGTELVKVYKGLDRKIQDLQNGVLEVRMVPLRQVFEKLSRVVRRLRRDTDKDVALEIRGADTELDKLIVEELVDPLMHVVRNAFDHAIESPEERLAAGKPTQGTIHLEAFQRGNHVVIEVRDDGRGIDASAVRARAIERGMIQRDETLSRKETLDLIFAAGLSTRDEVTETSGRGVGMDVVRSNVTSLGGLVDVASELGRGTTISFTLPITLAIIQALIVRVGGQRFGIPLNSVLETLLVEPERIQRSENRELFNLRGEPLLLRRLAPEFGLAAPPPETKQFVVVLGAGESRIGLVVEHLEGQQDAVIKPIQGPVRSVRGIAGATELGDQTAVLVLDVSALLEDAGRKREAA